MSRLEAVEIKLSQSLNNKDFRLDSPFWTSTLIKNNNLKYDKIRNILVKSQYGISISMNEENKGYPIYRMNEITNMLCDLQVDKYADIDKTELKIFKLKNKDVLFNRTNSFEWVGRTGIFYENNCSDFIFASYLVRFVPIVEKIKPEYLTAFLSSKYGIKAIKARSRQSINQTNVNPEEVKEIEIPLLDTNLQDKIVQNFEQANELRIKAASLYTAAQNILLDELGFTNYTPTNESVSIKTFADSFGSSGRLDAEYYQPKYEEIEKRIKNYTNGFDNFNSLCNLYDNNYTPTENANYKYIELSNIGKHGEISNVEYQLGKELPTRARRKINAEQVIISSIEGSLESCALITDEYDNALCSTGFYVVNSDILNSETLLMLFKSFPIQAILKQRCSGTILTAINKDEFLTVLLPIIRTDIQEKIAYIIKEMYATRKKSTELLDYAKQAVEIAIEQGEDAAVKWLNEKGVQQ